MGFTPAEVYAALERDTRARDDATARSGALAASAGHSPKQGLVVGFVEWTWDMLTSPSPFGSRLFDGINARARAASAAVLCFSARQEDEHACLELCRQHEVSGIVLHGYEPDHPPIQKLVEAAIPCVGVDWAGGIAPRLGHVSSDSIGAVAAAVRHLHSLGRRRIATLAVPDVAGPAGRDRLLGYLAGLDQVGLEPRDEYVVNAGWGHRDGKEGMEKLLALGEPPDAVFAVSDMAAIGAMATIVQAGLRVPEDIAIVGFDDMDYAALVTPGLTTLRQDIVGLGTASVEGLLRMIESPLAGPVELQLPCELVVRESCGARLRPSSEPAAGASSHAIGTLAQIGREMGLSGTH